MDRSGIYELLPAFVLVILCIHLPQVCVTQTPCDVKSSELCSEYDFIVVGAGSAGAVVASRLSEQEEWRILLLEAGGEETVISQIPGMCSLLFRTPMDWQYVTEPQEHACLGLKNNRCSWPRGKVLGGSSAINYMMYTRGARGDFDGWAKHGNPGWSYKDVLPYFLKSEDNKVHKNEYHKQGGPLTVEDIQFQTPLTDAFMKAAELMGYEKSDCNGANLAGFSVTQTTTRNGWRCSTNKAFLEPSKCRPNLHISTFSHVTKILINPSTKIAYGVEYTQQGVKKMATARKEIILSGGTINSPQLLMLSGVGPKDHLESLGIPVIEDLPGVGQNLQDHVAFGSLLFTVNDSVTLRPDRILGDTNNFLTYLSVGNGPLSSAGGESVGFVYTSHADKMKDEPDMELIMFPAFLGSDGGKFLINAFGLKQEVYDKAYRGLLGKDAFTIIPILLRPKSRGSIRLKSADPMDKPLIYANYLSDPNDIAVESEGIKLGLSLVESEPFKKYNAKLHDIPIPGCESHTFRSDAYWECATRHITFNIYHYSGTCKMGPSLDPMAVVDPELRVYHIKGLRVADASIMPQIVSAHTNAAAIMIGEKVSDLIKNSY